jgi:hypothetical protein
MDQRGNMVTADEIPSGYEFEMLRQQGLDDCDELLHNLNLMRQEQAERELRDPAQEWIPPSPPAEAPVRRARAVEPRDRPQQQAGVDWEATGHWVQAMISARLKVYTDQALVPALEEAGKLCGELKARIDQQAEKIAALEQRLDAEIRAAQDAKIAALEARIAEAEARAMPKPGKPQLVIGGEG